MKDESSNEGFSFDWLEPLESLEQFSGAKLEINKLEEVEEFEVKPNTPS